MYRLYSDEEINTFRTALLENELLDLHEDGSAFIETIEEMVHLAREIISEYMINSNSSLRLHVRRFLLKEPTEVELDVYVDEVLTMYAEEHKDEPPPVSREEQAIRNKTRRDLVTHYMEYYSLLGKGKCLPVGWVY